MPIITTLCQQERHRECTNPACECHCHTDTCTCQQPDNDKFISQPGDIQWVR
jgi:hypothetical protein